MCIRDRSSGEWFSDNLDEVVIGGGVAQILSLGIYDYNDFLILTVPKRSATSAQFKKPFISKTTLVSGIYSVSEELDKKHIFSNLTFAQELFQRKKYVYSSLEFKLKADFNRERLENELKSLLNTCLLYTSPSPRDS